MKKKKRLRMSFLIIIIIGAALYFYVNSYVEKSLNAVEPGDKTEITVEIPEGSSTGNIARILYENNLIHDQNVFKYYAKKTKADSQLKAGSFALSKGMNMDELLEVLIKGGTSGNTLNLTLIEGLTLEESAKAISEQMGLNYNVLVDLMKNADRYRDDYQFLKDNPGIKNLQGYLLPETYNVYKSSDEESIVKMLLSQFDEFYKNGMLPMLGKNSKLDTAGIVNLASIVEKEAALAEERDEIAKTFLNRLDIDMMLQSCATVNYARGEWKERLTSEDIKIDSPYNTYVVKGLPPTPINSPGKESIKAVLSPADVDYLYFVAKGDGSHHFSKDYNDHVAAKNKYLN